ncbi:unnamed protein product [Trichogramma brassicae]|uniref:Uncharacterized protein n=1 Tax=Trichogramma brassicae TaxID=86971 RepID=A0A6H5I1L9_9HYME|nr:unnamed protein product [Trichogramma brassicae]
MQEELYCTQGARPKILRICSDIEAEEDRHAHHEVNEKQRQENCVVESDAQMEQSIPTLPALVDWRSPRMRPADVMNLPSAD